MTIFRQPASASDSAGVPVEEDADDGAAHVSRVSFARAVTLVSGALSSVCARTGATGAAAAA